jgi:arylsulfatase A-like enzyme
VIALLGSRSVSTYDDRLGSLDVGTSPIPTYCGVRTVRYKYVQYEEQIDDHVRVSEELYVLAADPYELENLAADMGYAGLKAALHRRMVNLCAPPPPRYTP